MKISYCLPIISQTKKEVLDRIDQSFESYAFFEIWLDYVEDLDIKFIKDISAKLGSQLILLFRRQNLETVKLSPEKRFEILNVLNGTAGFIDLDIRTQQSELKYIIKKDIKINTILSFHNYKMTPDEQQLNEIISEMEEIQPAIYKISTFCQSEADALRLMRLLINLKAKRYEFIILGMGEQGIITRVFGTIWGNRMIFAPQKKSEASAPGQLTKSQLESIITTLNY